MAIFVNHKIGNLCFRRGSNVNPIVWNSTKTLEILLQANKRSTFTKLTPKKDKIVDKICAVPLHVSRLQANCSRSSVWWFFGNTLKCVSRTWFANTNFTLENTNFTTEKQKRWNTSNRSMDSAKTARSEVAPGTWTNENSISSARNGSHLKIHAVNCGMSCFCEFFSSFTQTHLYNKLAAMPQHFFLA